MAEKDKTKNSDADSKNEKIKRRKAIEKREKKHIKSLINFPFKALTHISLLGGLLAFVIKFYGHSAEIMSSLFAAFITFSVLYIGGGLLLVTVFYLIGEVKKREKIDVKKQKLEKSRLGELRNEEELTRLEELQRMNDLKSSGVSETNGIQNDSGGESESKRKDNQFAVNEQGSGE